MNHLIRAQEAADILGVSRETVWRWAVQGKLVRSFVIGKESFFDRSYIEREALKRKAERKLKRAVAA